MNLKSVAIIINNWNTLNCKELSELTGYSSDYIRKFGRTIGLPHKIQNSQCIERTLDLSSLNLTREEEEKLEKVIKNPGKKSKQILKLLTEENEKKIEEKNLNLVGKKVIENGHIDQYDMGEDKFEGRVLVSKRPKNLNDAAKLFEDIDLNIWKPIRMKIQDKHWDVTMRLRKYDDEGHRMDDEPVQYTNKYYGVTVTFERADNDPPPPKEFAKIMKDLLKDVKIPDWSGVSLSIGNIKGDHLIEICNADLHLGKLGWHSEVGEDFDIKIASERFRYANNDLLIKTNAFPCCKILYPIGNDFFQTDTINNTTTAGTQVDTDSRWQKRFCVGEQLITEQINILLQKQIPIDIVIISGNHDYTTMFYLGEYLKAYYKNNPLVNVINTPEYRKHYLWNNVYIMYDHGNAIRGTAKSQGKEYFRLMANYKGGEYWAKSKWREAHIAHIHHEKMIDISGVQCRWLKALSGYEFWDDKHGYRDSIRGSQAFVWHKKLGLSGIIYSYCNNDEN